MHKGVDTPGKARRQFTAPTASKYELIISFQSALVSVLNQYEEVEHQSFSSLAVWIKIVLVEKSVAANACLKLKYVSYNRSGYITTVVSNEFNYSSSVMPKIEGDYLFVRLCYSSCVSLKMTVCFR